MEIIVKVNKLEDVYTLDNVDAYLLANRQFSYRFVESFCINKINKVRKYAHENNKKVYVLINKIFKDDELEKLEVFLTKLKKAKVDGIFFTDFAVFMLAEKLEMSDKCIFYHETFLRNTYDILTYQESGIKKIICSKDMHLKDIKLLPKEKKDTYGIICFGYIPLYESQRKILTHYISMNKLPKSLIHSTTLSLKEHTRDDRYKVIEQEGVSSIFDSKVYSYLSYIKELSENINMFIVDSLFFETSYIKEVVELIKKAHQGIDVNEQLIKLDESISFTDGFLNKKIGLM
jgi:putative protease